MSLNAVVRKPVQPVVPEKKPQRKLQPVTRPAVRRKPKLAYALVALGGALAIGAAQIALSLATTQDSFTLASLSSQQRELNLKAHALQEELTGLSSPQVLANNAAGLGMVVAGSPSYLRLSDGAVFGTGAGADWTSTVNPEGVGAVSNSLIVEPPPPLPAETDEGTTEAPTQDLPPSITDGLPSPATH
ncbi:MULTISPECIES: hypothetical protein [unclassified Microbacterium]|uniref:hypothetical protein n=1 Tax=unclassified Microbacterium TaxID=2609290 RepID=UPI000CFCB474|nr:MULTISPECIES: hypothetical protein [unclassified Microbacterium]PQZ60457.1 hypothetical protein CQ032_02780 [Microbacterium sp. MYb43]PQZ81883.1 hypothetical protein CQ031_00180 [Microbacterium sp. MYb40]PRB22146.1 hypothetical protein CQ040_05755 [Microbacterium sp. MYb54]PRB31289.1 hypothetical protein CQ037_04275 [Microbacterium sp. MYb50]PRB69898.1 hypothetical protein CQ021_04055 [Microbacterium sp. MYb24]